MTNPVKDLSPQRAVLFLRFLYPIWAIVGMFSLIYLPSQFIVPGDLATTAANIMANEVLFRIGIVGSLLTQIIFIITALVLYKLFESVNKNHAVQMLLLALVGVPIAMLNVLNSVAIVELLSNPIYLNVFTAEQLQAMMSLFLHLGKQGTLIATIFWGLWLIPMGLLVRKSGYFPKILGAALLFAAFGYVLDSASHLLLPNYSAYEPILMPIVTVLTLGEVIFMLWVLFRGAKLP